MPGYEIKLGIVDHDLMLQSLDAQNIGDIVGRH